MEKKQVYRRIFHLPGGLRAFDLDGQWINIGTEQLPQVRAPRPGNVLVWLQSAGLTPVGCELSEPDNELKGLYPPQWRSWSPSLGFGYQKIFNEWAMVRHHASKTGDVLTSAVARKVRAYIRLVNLRLFQLSVAYQSMLQLHMVQSGPKPIEKEHLFSGMWQDEVEAGIHGFLADAASMRDALAEAVWLLILKRAPDVQTITSLISKAKNETHPLIVQMLKDADTDGWLRNLALLRNHFLHEVPVSSANEHPLCALRLYNAGSASVPMLHFPLTTKDWGVRRGTARAIDFSKEEAVMQSYQTFGKFVEESGDALQYASRTLTNLLQLADRVRVDAGLKSEMLKLSDADLVSIEET